MVLEKQVKINGEGFLNCIKRKGTPDRVYYIELYLDKEIRDAINERYKLLDCFEASDPFREHKGSIKTNRFLGYDYVLAGVECLNLPLREHEVEDTADLKKQGGRSYVDERIGPITTWEEFEKYPWPNLKNADTSDLEWYEKNLPDDMVVIGGLTGHIMEGLMFLMGYETLCIALFEQRDLVKAIYDRISAQCRHEVWLMSQFSRVRMIWGSDDMGFKSGTLISPEDMREFVFPAHKELAQTAHDNGKLYLLHACGNLVMIMDDLINDVKIDAKHSFEDTIEDIREVKQTYGKKIALFGGMDVDFLCRASEQEIRLRVRDTIAACQPGGGFCLGTGNSVANYIPLDNYLAMLDEGRRA
ncbi:MAG: hypothetical protein A2268_13395 [Candidatus Raymondbacteria bacterium RifOxyA12_full_50_37]|uniref:Uroporphyrinogen decarboxylase (URO-D) domain-containing protein n=1 Tax=Candidatus Raymondbacteria bacterium RIFOXYD12_FULL_49_13 TaxID=1817890 RepID=A0A1F7FDD0_UNCRA|nr:MAG: hypothetical protein A2268_13395 [Candidatus Raymondbacteria bacterium RifOxyA12_full_50_37]OGJ91813.1 MAG: hypothetical protein A2248_00285 [Candidatus Raymondbacteria bacterium RIFOXYA2_FULL_49_16]OGK00755.1 MAG: hypothetical protein A2350_18885 [Candidatus Raymondbacteria bacterium RifOxyB12_full_50_8]OGK04700.1 MAG: hypothetical protein A2519_18640 [Candidatus Raymondbacteria bacterium RIFOXYD12_FULL_49_13]OGK07904.1 MAG: hypothetical protein A2487_17345 [Candidatus Raymondbacteria 